jgi:hypothetical protein
VVVIDDAEELDLQPGAELVGREARHDGRIHRDRISACASMRSRLSRSP